jgi:probable O-glycosylation ligase (exosortase A-associated)
MADAAATWWRPGNRLWDPASAGFSRSASAGFSAARSSPIAFRALVAFTVILLLSPQIYFPILGTLRIAFLAAGLAIAAHLAHGTTHRAAAEPLPAPIRIALVLVAWAVVTIPLSYWPGGSVKTLTEHYLKAIAFFWLIAMVAGTVGRLRVLTWALVLCSIPLATTAVHNYLTGMFLSTGVPGLHRIYGYHGGSGLVGNPNDLALMLNLIIPLTGAVMLNARGALERSIAGVALVLSIIAVILTFSRAGFLTLAAALVVFLLMLVRRGSAGKAVLLLAAALLVSPLLPTGYTDRLSTIADMSADRTGSATGRWRDFHVAIELVQRNPIVGAGIGQDIFVMNETRGDKWTSVHNAFLQYAVDLGLPGLILFTWLYLSCLRSASRVERRAARDPALGELVNLAAGVEISLIAFGVASFFHPIAYQFYFFSVAGLAVALQRAYVHYGAGQGEGLAWVRP